MPGGNGRPPVMSFIRAAISASAFCLALFVARQIMSSRTSISAGSTAPGLIEAIKPSDAGDRSDNLHGNANNEPPMDGEENGE